MKEEMLVAVTPKHVCTFKSGEKQIDPHRSSRLGRGKAMMMKRRLRITEHMTLSGFGGK